MKWLCETVEVARSSFYAWLAGASGRAERAAADALVAQRITAIHTVDSSYGAPWITTELNDGLAMGQTGRVNRKRVAPVMRSHAIAGLRLSRQVRTTIPEPSQVQVPDLLNRVFTADVVNTVGA